MRKRLALAAVVAAASFAPLTSANAYCTDLSSVGGSSCYNPCGTVLGAYERADRAVKDTLPEHSLDCLL